MIHRVIAIFLIKRAGVKRSHTGAVTLIERAGSVAALNPHPYCLVVGADAELTQDAGNH